MRITRIKTTNFIVNNRLSYFPSTIYKFRPRCISQPNFWQKRPQVTKSSSSPSASSASRPIPLTWRLSSERYSHAKTWTSDTVATVPWGTQTSLSWPCFGFFFPPSKQKTPRSVRKRKTANDKEPAFVAPHKYSPLGWKPACDVTPAWSQSTARFYLVQTWRNANPRIGLTLTHRWGRR